MQTTRRFRACDGKEFGKQFIPADRLDTGVNWRVLDCKEYEEVRKKTENARDNGARWSRALNSFLLPLSSPSARTTLLTPTPIICRQVISLLRRADFFCFRKCMAAPRNTNIVHPHPSLLLLLGPRCFFLVSSVEGVCVCVPVVGRTCVSPSHQSINVHTHTHTRGSVRLAVLHLST